MSLEELKTSYLALLENKKSLAESQDKKIKDIEASMSVTLLKLHHIIQRLDYYSHAKGPKDITILTALSPQSLTEYDSIYYNGVGKIVYGVHHKTIERAKAYVAAL